ncbi:hypothetical protein PUN28_016930 [Cardiocondyla obscurior]|uniref:Uncharacterized protein n=1 Tax=Cardiocondyla obscurior TaxID=286306 RepID=A0AAW2ELP9_9HYME
MASLFARALRAYAQLERQITISAYTVELLQIHQKTQKEIIIHIKIHKIDLYFQIHIF